MFLYEQEASALRQARLANMIERVLHRLGDSQQQIWEYDEIERYLHVGAKEMVTLNNLLWDILYDENLPAGFSHTADWEEEYVTFNYGVASYTMEDEAAMIEDADLMEVDDLRMANHTSPSDLDLFATNAAISAYINPVSQLPANLTAIDRATWDNGWIEALSPDHIRKADTRFEITQGEVFGYMWRYEGPRTLRKVRVPSAMAETYTYHGSWGLLRDAEDIAEDADGTWGVARRVPGQFPMGSGEGWGFPRRFYKDEKNVRIEHFRQPEVAATESELPDIYFNYLADYCQWRALKRQGGGQDFKLAQYYKTRWDRGLGRIASRLARVAVERVRRLGGGNGVPDSTRPPRPRLPWQYGSRVR